MANISMFRSSLICIIYLILLSSSDVCLAEDVKFEIVEEQAVGTIVGGIIEPSGLRQRYTADVLSKMQFSLLSDSGNEGSNKYFNVNINNGELSIKQKIDRETVCLYKSNCVLSLSVAARVIQPPQFESITVLVTIIDINDNGPNFQKTVEHIPIPENTEISSTFPLPEAIDNDNGANGVQSYTLSPISTKLGVATVQNPDGSMGIQLIVLQKLDRETKDNYKISLIATDGGTPSYSASILLNITIGDSNDNIATFEENEYISDVMEDIEFPSVIVQVKAIDNDLGDAGKVIYSFTSKTTSQHGDMFSIDRITGDITLLKGLDFEIQNEYTLTVTAKDSAPNARMSQATVKVYVHDVNDIAPQITINTLTANGQAEVVENATLDSFVAHVSVVDRDSRLNGQVQCKLDTTRYGLKKIAETQYKLVTASILDRETESFHNVKITCKDQGQPSLNTSTSIHVSILDVNDNPPEFEKSQYSLVIQENNPPDVYITTVKATDKDYGVNARVKYSFVEPDSKEIFDIDTNNGVIKAKTGLDYEKQHDIVLLILAKDSGNPMMSSTVTVQIQLLDINDNAPQFIQRNGQFNFLIMENEDIGSKIGQIQAKDADSPPHDVIEYRFENDRSFQLKTLFKLDPKTGIITSNQVFDRESKSLYQFNVVAYNPDAPLLKSVSVVNVYIEDANDLDPEFIFPGKENHTLQILPSLQAGDVITQIVAKDGDDGNNAWLSFDIISGNEKGYFIIGKSTGFITITQDLSQTQQTYFNLTIQAKDNGSPPRITSDWLLVALNATVPTEEGFPANMIILICLVSITGILMILLVVAILYLIYKSRYRNNTNPMNKFNSTEDPSNKIPHVEIIDRLDTSHLHVDLNSSFKGPAVYDYQKNSGRPGNINSHTSADSGFDEVTISPHGKLVSFRAAGPDNECNKDRIPEEDDMGSTPSEDGSNTDSGCVLSETGAEDTSKDSRDQQQQPMKYPNNLTPIKQQNHPGYVIIRNTKAAKLYPENRDTKPQNEYEVQKVNPLPLKQTVRDIKSKDRLKKLNNTSHQNLDWPDVCKTSNSDITNEGVYDNSNQHHPQISNFYDSNSLMRYKMDPNVQRCGSEMTDNTSTTSGSYVLTGEDQLVSC